MMLLDVGCQKMEEKLGAEMQTSGTQLPASILIK